MILGIGTDIASIDRIARVLGDHGDRFTARCFAPEERARVEKNADEKSRASGYAKRWAAKEACAKALGLGIREQIYLKDITVVNDDAGRPSMALAGGAKTRLTELTPAGMTPRIDVSLSDDGGMALAFVVISAGGAI
ncbi:MAG: holo-ACP synthase [bacterium]|nr:holo-ACP synthase [bacterium]